MKRRAPDATIMIRSQLVVLTLFATGCSTSTSSTLPAEPGPTSVSMRISEIQSDGAAVEVTRDVELADLKGEYYHGDGLGYNLHLKLMDRRAFECTWTGCLGKYGESSGNWTADESGLNLTTDTADGLVRDRPVGRLRVISFQGHYLLVQEKDSGWFDEHGPDTFACFHRDEAREALSQDWRRRIERRVDEQ